MAASAVRPIRAPLLGLAAAVLALAAAGAVAAPRQRGAQAPAEAPLPPPRPDAARTPEGGADAIPSPPPRPSDLASDQSPPAPAAAAEEPAAKAAQEPDPDEAPCRARLAELGVRFEPLRGISQGQCGAPYPLLVSRLPGGLELSPPATIVCPVAEALARWMRDVVVAEAGRQFETPPVRIAVGTSYECRSQNRVAGAKLSEHAFANAVDVMSFTLDKGKQIAVGEHPTDSPEARFLAAVRSRACTYFTTVLGPGSDSAHATHLHLDLRGRNRGYRMCQ